MCLLFDRQINFTRVNSRLHCAQEHIGVSTQNPETRRRLHARPIGVHSWPAQATVNERKLHPHLLAALKSLGLVTENDGRFRNAPAASKFLVAGAPGDFRDYVRLVNGAFGYEKLPAPFDRIAWPTNLFG
jgi:hypothetical protein